MAKISKRFKKAIDGVNTEKAYDTFISENAQKLAEAERQADDYEHKLGKSVAKLDHMTLRAPLSGIIQASSVTTVGQVLTSGEEIMRIVPEDAALPRRSPGIDSLSRAGTQSRSITGTQNCGLLLFILHEPFAFGPKRQILARFLI